MYFVFGHKQQFNDKLIKLKYYVDEIALILKLLLHNKGSNIPLLGFCIGCQKIKAKSGLL